MTDINETAFKAAFGSNSLRFQCEARDILYLYLAALPPAKDYGDAVAIVDNLGCSSCYAELVWRAIVPADARELPPPATPGRGE